MTAPLFTEDELCIIFQSITATRDRARDSLERRGRDIARHNKKRGTPGAPKSFADTALDRIDLREIASAEAIMAKIEAEPGYPCTVRGCAASPANHDETTRTS